MRLSITTILRWLRMSMRPRKGCTGEKPIGSARASLTPGGGASPASACDLIISREPRPSAIARQVTPRAAARFSASTTFTPLLSGSQM